MSNMINKLKEWQCDVDGALERFINDEDLYIDCLKEFARDEAFTKLGEAIAGNDIGAAFDYAHTLKGVAANLGLTPLYAAICEVVEPLRAKQTEGIGAKYVQMLEQYKKYLEIATK